MTAGSSASFAAAREALKRSVPDGRIDTLHLCNKLIRSLAIYRIISSNSND